MSDEQATVERFYDGWKDYQLLLLAAIEPLTAENMAVRAGDGLTIEEIATHMIGARMRWIWSFSEASRTAVRDYPVWDEPERPVRCAREIVEALDTTWNIMHGAIDSWTPAEWAEHFDGDVADGQPANLARRWVIWHLIEHDLHHGGEISLLLGSNGLKAPAL